MTNTSKSESSETRRATRPSRVARPSQGVQSSAAQSLRSVSRTDGAVHSQDSKGINPVETAIRLISETAHDLRSPLASVSATMEMLVDGALGDVSESQQDFIRAAQRQCEYLDALVNEMLHADGLLNGMTTLRRRPVHPKAIEQMVLEATTAVLVSKRTELLFDGITDQSSQTYIDPSIVCRLLVNLVVNAERASGEDGHILVRLDEQADLGVTRWSVIDCGEGMSAQQLDNCETGRASQPSQSTGLGLMICRQLAALNFSDLTIRSRLGTGTDVTFETPIAQASSIASAYARFRTALSVSPGEVATGSKLTNNPQAESSSWNECRLGHVGSGPQRASRVAIGTLSIPGDSTNEESEQIDQLLQNRLGRFEMSYQTSRRSWVWVFDADHRNIDARFSQISSAVSSFLPGVALLWGEPSVAPVNQKSLQRMLLDRMIKQSLSSATSVNGGHIDHDSVRLGTQPIAATAIAAGRLDEELQRLSKRLKGQTKQLRDQSKTLRPPKQ